MKTRSRTPIVILLLLASTLAQYGCGGGGTDSAVGTTSSGSSISGGVTAPGGVIAFNRPHSLWRMFARLFVGEAVADLPGVVSVGAGVTVSLIQIDNSGNQVGAALATTTTDGSGNYTLTLPAGITPGPNYVIQAGSSGTHIQSFITGTTVNVDPYTHATVTLITGAVGAAQSSITGVSTADIAAVQQTVLQTSGDVSTAGTTASQLVTALQTSIANNIESNNIVTSITAQGSITGTVTDSGSTAVAGVQIMVRTFGDQTTMAITRTDASGNYTVHVPAGDYIVGALNDTATSTAASQWWTASGGTTGMFLAEKVTVATTAVTRSFSLAAGGRISGTVTAGTSSTTLPGIQATLCAFASGQTLMWVRTQPDGTYNFNVAPGDYYLTFRNSTLASYGTGIYNSAISGGGTNKTQGEKITVTAGAGLTANIGLVAGGLVSGTVTDGTTAAAGIAVRFQDSTGAYAESTRTGVDGTYRMWVQPGQYNILCRGQQYSSTSTVNDPGRGVDRDGRGDRSGGLYHGPRHHYRHGEGRERQRGRRGECLRVRHDRQL